ncbi:MAG: acyl-CoA dehydrogenase [Kangiellaceae bacterium]|nr:acyl-CoA dehydrogenase [Kangiellaceae bacterium]
MQASVDKSPVWEVTMSYKAPVSDMSFLLKDVFAIQENLSSIEQFSDFDYDLYNAVLEEAAKFAEQVLEPINRNGDEQGCLIDGTEVTTPAGFKEAYQQYCEGGWQGINGDPNYGGQGLPKALHVAIEEMLYAANSSFCLYPSLTSGATAAINAHASEELKNTYLENMTSGVWSGTMCLTEPHCGSDLGILKTKAEPIDDTRYQLTGTKIFITGGEHDLAENIIHLVLARLPDAPAGPRGISLFLVPKFLVNAGGSLGERNPITCGSIEHKMGIKGSATCVMNLDNAEGYLIGEPHKGLAAMFTMMNKERLSIALQNVGLADASYQIAREYAADRVQGRSQRDGKQGAAIIEHSDVRRMLMTMRSINEANRAFGIYLGMQLDLEEHAADETIKLKAKQRAALLIPIAKAYFSDTGFDNCNHGVQVLGGHGYVREWGVEQFVRDARISQIYEGSNGIQAQDFLMRKVCADKGAAINDLFADIEATLAACNDDSLASYKTKLTDMLGLTKAITDEMIEQVAADNFGAQGGAVEYLHLTGIMLSEWFWLQQLMAMSVLPDQEQKRKLAAADFFFDHVATKATGYAESVRQGYGKLYQLADELI